MEDLKRIVKEELEPADEVNAVNKLQRIGDELVCNYVLKIGDITIEPLWVEAYYFQINGKFKDVSCHRKAEQMKNFGKLYFHHRVGDQRSGVDLCLSDGDYYLSYLLKITLVNGVYTTQSELHNKIYNAYIDNGEKLTIEKSNFAKKCCNAKRIRVTDGDYIEEPLASVRGVDEKLFGEKRLPNREELVKNYIMKNCKSLSNDEKIKYCTDILGYCLKDIKEGKI